MKFSVYCNLILICSILWAPFSNSRLTYHFIYWLESNGYSKYHFQRDDVGGLSYGGRTNDNDNIKKQPIVLIHGNVGNASEFDSLRQYFIDFGTYNDCEIYATTWGIPDKGQMFSNSHKRQFVNHIRKFLEAVLNYTSFYKIDVIGYDMGVTLARAAIKGGQFWDVDVPYDLGPPLTEYVDTFIGVAGYNYGINDCYQLEGWPLCNRRTGFYPGVMTGVVVRNRSDFLEYLNRDPAFEGDYVFPIYSKFDEIIGNNNLVYCKHTSHIPNSTQDFILDEPKYTHVGVLELTAELQLQLLRDHREAY